MAAENDFEPHLGRIGDRGKALARKARSFSGQVMRAAKRAGGGAIDLSGGRPGPSHGRGASRFASRASARRVIVKARIIRHKGARFRAAPMGDHIRYLRREGVDCEGRAGEAFARDGVADHERFAARCEEDRHHFRFIVSPQDAEDLADLRATTRDLMARVERDLHTRLDWVAVDHWNTDNPHVHILVRGVADDGSDLVIDRDYIARGLRQQAEALVTLELGPRTQREIAAGLDREVAAHRWTSLDAAMRRRMDELTGEVDLRPQEGRFADGEARLIGRAQVLEGLGFAEARGPGRWALVSDLEPRLRTLSEASDIIKTLHRAMAGQGRDPAAVAIHGSVLGEPVVGRLVDRGLHDELGGEAYAIVDGLDGRLHHFRFRDLSITGDTPIGGLVEVRARPVPGGRPALDMVHRADLTIEAQVGAYGATWLDRQMVSDQPHDLAHTGFGAEVRRALEARGSALELQGLTRQQDGRRVLARDLVGTLRRRELARVTANIQAETGGAQATTSDRISGVYRRRLDLASGRFAMIDDGMGFQLVPWTRTLDAHLGEWVQGQKNPGGGIDWALGRKRGIGL